MSALVMSVAVATPAPTASPLKVIIEVHSRALCTALNTRIGPAVAGILKNDQIIDEGWKGMLRAVGNPQGRQMADLGLKSVVDALTHNVKAIDDLLASSTVFPDPPKTDDDERAAALKTKLQAILAKQKAAINAINGLIETDAMGDARSEGIWGAPNSIDELGPTYKDTSKAPMGAAAAATNITSDPNQLDMSGGPGGLIRDVRQDQRDIAFLESAAAPDVTQTAIECGGVARPSSSPTPDHPQ